MRIALIHTRLKRVGGLETRLFSYIDELTARGHEVTVIVSKIEHNEQLPDGVRVIRCSMKRVPKPIRIWYYDRAVHSILQREQFDFVLALIQISGVDALLVPGNHPGYLKAVQRRTKLLDRLVISVEQKCFSSAQTLLACSQMMKDEVVQLFGIAPEKIRVLHPPTDNQRFHSQLKSRKAEFRETYGFAKDKFSFLLVSASHRRKGLPLLIDAFSQLKNEPVEFILAGTPLKMAMPENMRYIGYAKKAEELFAAADALILPATYEPFGQIVSEAIMCGTPVLLSHMVGAKAIVSENEGMIVNSFSVDDWVKAIREMTRRQFNIAPDFAVQQRLLLRDHVDAILDVAENRAN